MQSRFHIGKRQVGEGAPAFLIAEAGSNHNQKISRAKALIDAAAASGADAVKFQLFNAEDLYSSEHPAFKTVKACEFPREWVKPLDRYAKKKKILFMATPFDRQAVDLLCAIGSPALKWGSSETTNLSLLKYAAAKNIPLLISTGMCDMADIYEAMEVVEEGGCDKAALLHCVSVYPAEAAEVNLRVMDSLRASFGVPVGFSDHTLGLAAPVAAAALGASVIEKHFTLDRKLKGPDHFYALEPDELKQMVAMIRETESSLGSSVKRVLPLEKKWGRREGLYAARAISKGTKLTPADLRSARPATGIRARYRGALTGFRAKKTIRKDQPLSWEDITG